MLSTKTIDGVLVIGAVGYSDVWEAIQYAKSLNLCAWIKKIVFYMKKGKLNTILTLTDGRESHQRKQGGDQWHGIVFAYIRAQSKRQLEGFTPKGNTLEFTVSDERPKYRISGGVTCPTSPTVTKDYAELRDERLLKVLQEEARRGLKEWEQRNRPDKPLVSGQTVFQAEKGYYICSSAEVFRRLTDYCKGRPDTEDFVLEMLGVKGEVDTLDWLGIKV